MKYVGMDCFFLVIGDRCWGRGCTRAEALSKARDSGGTAGVKRYAVYLVLLGTRVDAMGNLVWPGESTFEPIMIEYYANGKPVDPGKWPK